MDVVLDLQAMEGPELMDSHGHHDHGHGHSHLSLLAACAHSTISLLGCW
jgi:lanthionine-containing peptide SapB